jgi:hypothetical protein
VCVTLLGGPWRFLHSEILAAPIRDSARGGGGGARAGGGVALRALGLGECYVRACRLGGQSRRRRCGEAVVVEEHAEVRMKSSMLQEARFALVRALDMSRLTVTGGLFRAGSYALGLANEVLCAYNTRHTHVAYDRPDACHVCVYVLRKIIAYVYVPLGAGSYALGLASRTRFRV